MDEEKITRMLEDLEQRADVRAAFGEARQVGEKTIIPVARVGWAGGMGFGRGWGPRSDGGQQPAPEQEAAGPAGGAGGGGGGWLRVTPVAVIEVTATETRVRAVVDSTSIAIAGILLGAWNVFWLARMLQAIFGKRG